jgi:hypothetical protein
MAQLISEARLRHAHELNEATPLARIRLEWKIQREVQAGLKKRFPLEALYAVAPFEFVHDQSSDPTSASVTPSARQKARRT